MLKTLICISFWLTLAAAAMPPECHKILNAATSQNQTIVSLTSQLAKHQCTVKLAPRYKWAQNSTHIFLKVEFLTST